MFVRRVLYLHLSTVPQMLLSEYSMPVSMFDVSTEPIIELGGWDKEHAPAEQEQHSEWRLHRLRGATDSSCDSDGPTEVANVRRQTSGTSLDSLFLHLSMLLSILKSAGYPWDNISAEVTANTKPSDLTEERLDDCSTSMRLEASGASGYYCDEVRRLRLFEEGPNRLEWLSLVSPSRYIPMNS